MAFVDFLEPSEPRPRTHQKAERNVFGGRLSFKGVTNGDRLFSIRKSISGQRNNISSDTPQSPFNSPWCPDGTPPASGTPQASGMPPAFGTPPASGMPHAFGTPPASGAPPVCGTPPAFHMFPQGQSGTPPRPPPVVDGRVAAPSSARESSTLRNLPNLGGSGREDAARGLGSSSRFGSPNSSMPGSPSSSSVAASPHPVMGQIKETKGQIKETTGGEMRVHATFEKHMLGTMRGGSFASNDTTMSFNSGETSSSDAFCASGPEDMVNDAALGAFLAATNAAARSRRQRAVEEALPRSQQLLNQGTTRRNRRMSSDASVCETRPWVDALQGSDVKAKREAAKQLRLALKDGPENRMRLVASGGVMPLVLALKSTDSETVENAAAAVLFLCLSRDTVSEVVQNGGVRMLIQAVGIEDPFFESGRSNAAAALFALSQRDDNRKLVHSQGAIKPLVQLLKSSKTTRGKKDSCLALFNMAPVPRGAEEMVGLGVVERAVELLEEAEEGVEEKAAALLGALCKTEEGLKAVEDDEDALFALADTLEGGSVAAAEHATVALYHLAAGFPKVVPRILAEGCLPPLVRLALQSKKGSDSRLLLDILRAYCKRKAKAEETKRIKEAGRPPSRLSVSGPVQSEGSGRMSLVDRDSLMKQWSGETVAFS